MPLQQRTGRAVGILGEFGPLDIDIVRVGHPLQLKLVLVGRQDDGGARLSGPRGAPGAVDDVLVILRHVVNKDVAEVGHVNTAGGHVRRHQEAQRAVAQAIERLLPLRL